MNVNAQSAQGLAIPFDHARLDRLMDEAGIDVVLATSKHNVQYLLGGHRADFFDYMDATGVTPLSAGPRLSEGPAGEGRLYRPPPGKLPASRTSRCGRRRRRPPPRARSTPCRRRSTTSARPASRPSASPPSSASCPTTPRKLLRAAFPDADWVDALFVLERQRVKKSAAELKMLKVASEAVLEFDEGGDRQPRAGHDQGRRRRDAAARGDQSRAHVRILPDHLRHQPSTARRPTRNGRRARSCRSTAAATITAISATSAAWRSRASRMPSSRICWPRSSRSSARRFNADRAPARMGREIYAAAEPLVQKSKHHNHLEFLAHGMGMVSHEAPRLTDHGPVPYPSD